MRIRPPMIDTREALARVARSSARSAELNAVRTLRDAARNWLQTEREEGTDDGFSLPTDPLLAAGVAWIRAAEEADRLAEVASHRRPRRLSLVRMFGGAR